MARWIAAVGWLIAWCWVPAAHADRARAVIDAAPAAETVSTAAEIHFHAEPAPLGPQRFTCSVDGAPHAPCASPLRLQGLATGGHAVEIRLQAFLAHPAPATHRWTVVPEAVLLPCGDALPCRPLPVPRPKPSPSTTVDGCRDGGAQLVRLSLTRLERSVRCLLVHERRERRRSGLRHSAALGRSSAAHARDMVRRRFYSHHAPGGATLSDRVRRTGYLRGRWILGEVLMWVGNRPATPATIVRAWLNSPPHRRVVLRPVFRDAGVGAARGTPAGDTRGATIAVHLGARG